MSSREPEHPIKGVEDVSRAYVSAGFDEQPPPHVDRAILAAARRRSRPRLASFVPALALAATVVLSFSLVLRSGMLGIGGPGAPTAADPVTFPELRQENVPAPEPATRNDREQDALAPESFVDAPQGGGLSSTSTLRQERALNESPAPAEPGVRPRLADENLGRETRPALEAQAARQLEAPQAAAAELEEAALRRSIAAPETAGNCPTQGGEDPTAWLECIARLLEGGAEELARQSLAGFVEAHPEYPLPEALRALQSASPR